MFYPQKLEAVQAPWWRGRGRRVSPVIANVGDNCTADTVVYFARRCRQAGRRRLHVRRASTTTSLPQEGLYRHFRTHFADAVELPIHPVRTSLGRCRGESRRPISPLLRFWRCRLRQRRGRAGRRQARMDRSQAIVDWRSERFPPPVHRRRCRPTSADHAAGRRRRANSTIRHAARRTCMSAPSSIYAPPRASGEAAACGQRAP
ncbi:MAG: hypothetical protein ACLTDR_06985 [Adlercreutzia equolifaciens]